MGVITSWNIHNLSALRQRDSPTAEDVVMGWISICFMLILCNCTSCHCQIYALTTISTVNHTSPFQVTTDVSMCGPPWQSIWYWLWSLLRKICCILLATCPDSNFHGAHMWPTWVMSAPGEPHVGSMNLDIWVMKVPWFHYLHHCFLNSQPPVTHWILRP